MKSRPYRGISHIETLVALGTVTLLSALLFGVVGRARLKGRQQTATCASNLQQLARAINLYVQDNNSTYPAIYITLNKRKRGVWWYEAVAPYVKSNSVFHCPTFTGLETAQRNRDSYRETNYFFNQAQLNIINPKRLTGSLGLQTSRITSPNITTVSSDGFDTYTKTDGSGEYVPDENMAREVPVSCERSGKKVGVIYHQGGGNYSFADGHVKWLTPEAYASLWCQSKS